MGLEIKSETSEGQLSEVSQIVRGHMRRRIMKVVYYVLPAMVVLLSSSCCSGMRQLNEPERPSKVRGWEGVRDGETFIDGIFLLNKGESTDNGKIGIRLVETYAGKCRLFNEREYPKAKLQFYRVSDKEILCESIFDRGNTGLEPPICGADLEWSVIGIIDINSKDKWIVFNLRE
jgi:hypothetical protein